MTGRLVLLDCSPHVAPGLLTASAWNDLWAADRVLVGVPDHPQLAALKNAGVTVEVWTESDPARRADSMLAAAQHEVVVWLLAPEREPELTAAIADRLVSATAPAVEVEHQLGSYDLPGSRLLDLVAVMGRLRSPGGCAWDAKQTHESLLRYVVEEAYEVVEAVESGDREHLCEELGDLLAQVVFHAGIAAERLTDGTDDGFSIDDVADGIVAKLVRRHPHVFAGGPARTPVEVEASWEQIKTVEKGRTSVLDGIPPGLPALSYAEKLLVRTDRSGRPGLAATAGPAADSRDSNASIGGDNEDDAEARIDSAETLGAALLRLVVIGRRLGIDPESALRRAARQLVADA